MPSNRNTPTENYLAFLITGLSGYNIKRGVFFNPDPYVKIRILPGQNCKKFPHHKQKYETKQVGDTTNPTWKEQFYVQVLESDIIELEVKDRFDRGRPVLRRFLGKLEVKVSDILERLNTSQHSYTGILTKRSPLDHTSGSLSFVMADGRSALFGAYQGANNNSRTRSSVTSSDLSFNPALPPSRGLVEDMSHALDICFCEQENLMNNHSRNDSFNNEQVPSNDLSTTPPSRDPIAIPLSNTPIATHPSNDNIATFPSNDHIAPFPSNDHVAPPSYPSNEHIASHPSNVESTVDMETDESDTVLTPVGENGVTMTEQVCVGESSKLLDVSNNKSLHVSNNNNVGPEEQSSSTNHIVNEDQSSTMNNDSNPAKDVPASGEIERSQEIGSNSVATDAPGTSTKVKMDLTIPPFKNRSDKLAVPSPNPHKTGKKAHTKHEKEHLLNLLKFVALTEGTTMNGNGEQQNSDHMGAIEVIIHRTSDENHLGFNIMGGSESKHQILRRMGIYVTRVEPNSLASNFGVKVHDRLLSINNISLSGSSHKDAVVAIQNAGKEVVIKVERRTLPSNVPPQHGPSVTQFNPTALPSKRRLSLPVNLGGRNFKPLTVTPSNPGLKLTKVPAYSTAQLMENHIDQSRLSDDSIATPSGNMAPSIKRRDRLIGINDNEVFAEVSSSGLPPNWEACRDRHGRIFYLDHVNRNTQWDKPASSEPQPRAHALTRTGAQRHRRYNSVKGDRNYERVMRRYQSIKRVMRNDNESGATSSAQSPTTPPIDEVTEEVVVDGNQSTNHEAPVENESFPPQNAEDNLLPSHSFSQSPPQEEEKKKLLENNPGFKFISDPDFFMNLNTNEEAYSFYVSSSSLKYIIMKINRDKSHFKEYQHNKDLVKFINSFADISLPLPKGWEIKSGGGAKPFFIDHNLKMTTFFDPRLVIKRQSDPTEPTTSQTTTEPSIPQLDASTTDTVVSEPVRLEVQSPLTTIAPAVPPRPTSTLSTQSRILEAPPTALSRVDENEVDAIEVNEELPQVSYKEKVVAFLKQKNILDILKERHPSIASSQSLKDKIMNIRTDGLATLERYSNSMQLTILLSLFEEEISQFVVPTRETHQAVLAERPRTSETNLRTSSPVSSPATSRSRVSSSLNRNFDSKLRNFYRKLEQKGYGQGPGKIKLTVHRERLLEEAFSKVMTLSRKELQRSKLFVSFIGEEGLDYSGPSREFFFLISRELFNPYYGLFEYCAVDTYTVQISPLSAFVESPMEWFRFAGRIIGLCLIHHCLLDAFFTRPLYKMLLRSKCDLSDLRYVDEQFYQSIVWIKENDISGVLDDLTFSVDEEMFGKIEERELKPNGKNILVTEKNKKEYIDKMVKWRVIRGTREQTNMLIRGFNEVIDLRLVAVFDARELELVICGTADIDLADWRQNTEYRGGYYDMHPVIQWFWLALKQFDNERRLRLLQFVTGTSSIPYEGFAALRGPNGPKRFCIEKWGKDHCLPRAHTCFNRIDLPSYRSYATLWEKLVIAVEETSTFAME